MGAVCAVSGAAWLGCGDGGSGADGGADGATPNDSGAQDTGVPADSGPPSDSGSGGDAQNMDAGDGGAPDGATVLGCAAYCTQIMQVCTNANQQYLDMTTCTAMCAKLTTGDAGVMTGNTLACRGYHLSVAAMSAQNANMHCPHAGPYGFGQCGNECEDFCALYNAQCGANNFGGGGCTQACPNITNPASTSFLNSTGNTLDCREYHLENAYKNGDMNGAGHCMHAQNDGGGVCQ
jgi:hypothetical protein